MTNTSVHDDTYTVSPPDFSLPIRSYSHSPPSRPRPTYIERCIQNVQIHIIYCGHICITKTSEFFKPSEHTESLRLLTISIIDFYISHFPLEFLFSTYYDAKFVATFYIKASISHTCTSMCRMKHLFPAVAGFDLCYNMCF